MSPLQHYSMSSSSTTNRHANKPNYYTEDKNNQYQDHGYFSRSGRKTDTVMQSGRYDRRKARPDVFSPSNSKSAKNMYCHQKEDLILHSLKVMHIHLPKAIQMLDNKLLLYTLTSHQLHLVTITQSRDILEMNL